MRQPPRYCVLIAAPRTIEVPTDHESLLDHLAGETAALSEALTDVYLRHVFMARLPVDTRERQP